MVGLQYIVLKDTETVITALWREDLLPTYGPIDGIPKADGGMLYMGGIQWQIIGKDSSRALLISADQLGGTMGWESAKAYCGTVYASRFTGLEQNAVERVSKTDVDYRDRAYRASTLDNARLFLLSGWEADWYFDSESARQPGMWWLRSLHFGDTMAGVVGVNGGLGHNDTSSSGLYSVRPAFVLNLSSSPLPPKAANLPPPKEAANLGHFQPPPIPGAS